MPNEFTAEVFQNQFLPQGAGEVHAIMTVTASAGSGQSGERPAPAASRLIGIICDTSGSMEGGKLLAAKNAITRLLQMLPPGCAFFVIAGSNGGRVVHPVSPATPDQLTDALAKLSRVRADGGTEISTWLSAARDQFQQYTVGVRQAILLTDGQNDDTDQRRMDEELARCEGVFQCDCRGVGTDWDVSQLRKIATRLLGTVDIVPEPAQIDRDFQSILEKTLSKNVSDVVLRLWTPQGALVKFCKEVSPEIVDLTGRGRQVKPQVREYPTGAWGAGEARDYHFCIEVKPGAVGDEVLAGRASLVYQQSGAEVKAVEARILAIWTDDQARSTKIDRVVAHYTGQAELATNIQAGLEARAQGDTERATSLLGKAVKIAHDSGNESTAKLLRTVVEVEDAASGTVRLKRSVAKQDEMALDTRSTKTSRLRG